MKYFLIDYLCNPLIRAPALGSLFLGAASGLLGGLLALRKSCLMAETMSHASYPGLMLGVMLMSLMNYQVRTVESMWMIDLMAFGGAWIGSMLGLYFYSWILRLRLGTDSALCWVLTSFLGVGVLMASRLQFQSPRLYQRAQSFLYGQAATLSEWHLILFALLFIVCLLTVGLNYRQLLVSHFDPIFSKTQPHDGRPLRIWVHLLTTALIVTGIRAGGVLVMSALLVAPAVSARFFSRSFLQMMMLSMWLGALMGFGGSCLSLEIDTWAQEHLEDVKSLLPTGPAIALVGCSMALIASTIAPARGWLARWRRVHRLRARWMQELADQRSLKKGRDHASS